LDPESDFQPLRVLFTSRAIVKGMNRMAFAFDSTMGPLASKPERPILAGRAGAAASIADATSLKSYLSNGTPRGREAPHAFGFLDHV
jgi:hypothetical protein